MLQSNNQDKKFTQIITQEEVLRWDSNVILCGGTGTGKTHFILNTVAPLYATQSKRILFLCNRKSLKIQVELDVKKLGLTNVDVNTYQFIEYHIKHDSLKDKYLDNTYDLIVADECHYFTLESNYNYYTDLSYEWLLKHKGIKAFISATAKPLFRHLVEDKLVSKENIYIINKSDKHVKDIYFYNKKNDVEYILDDILTHSDDKVIYFTGSLEHGIEMYEKYKDYAQFVCAEQALTKKLKKIYTPIEEIIEQETFNKQLLITTTVAYNGLNFKDESIKHIITSVFEPEKVIQSLGRKRAINDDDTCTYYIRNYHKGELNLFLDKDSLEEMRLFKSDYDSYVSKYMIDRTYKNEYIYNDVATDELKLNNLALIKLESLEQDIKEMVNTSYFHCISRELNVNSDKIKFYEDVKGDKKMLSIDEFLESMIGKVMYSRSDRKELIEVIGLTDTRNRLLKGRDILNSYLIEMNFNYMIVEFDTMLTVEGKKKRYRNAWKVVKIVQ